MRINRIKISGFKSFVDPITLTLPGNLTGVVGPNGCGKSNIIDALIWVMGESSAKHLRGDSMADVIFNGSNSRKPVGQATVEIVFDNSDGTIGGQYAGFGEISIKRTISRDAVSTYSLNGSRCRRKDITNVFLGTGIGARGYSVIEQGMISRVIEARPEELRAFLEEAAGISKYKERRRETETRMRHSNENLERLDDIRDELEKQLNHLQRQARAAERYQVLKAEERRLNAKLLAARFRYLNGENDTCRASAEQRANEVEAAVARLREVEVQQTNFREAQVAATEEFNRIQGEFYGKTAEISRLEQALKHADERERGLHTDLEQISESLVTITRGLDNDDEELAQTKEQLGTTEPALTASREHEQQAFEGLRAVESRFEQWQHDWDSFNREHTELAQREHAIQIRLEHLLADVAGHDSRKSVLSEEAERNQTGELNATVAAARAEVVVLEQQRSETVLKRNGVRANLATIRGGTQTLEASLHQHQIELEEQRGRVASLRALQDAAYGDDQQSIERWFREQGIEEPQRLAEFVEIEAGWEAALEAALRLPLGAFCAAGLTARMLGNTRETWPGGSLTAIDLGQSMGAVEDNALLASRVRGKVDLTPLLAGIYTAETAAGAQRLLETLGEGDIVVLSDGTLFGSNWVQMPDQRVTGDSILARERQLAEYTTKLDEHVAATAALRDEVDSARANLKAEELAEHEISEALDALGRQISTQREQLSQMEAELTRREARAADVRAELERIAAQTSENRQAIEQLSGERDVANQALNAHAGRRDALAELRNVIQREMDAAREKWSAQRETAHSVELSLQQLRARQQALEESIARNTATRAELHSRNSTLEASMRELTQPLAAMRVELEQVLSEKLLAENALTEARQALGKLDNSMQETATQRAEIEQSISERQKRLEQVRLDLRALEVRMQELRGRFEQTGEDFDATIAALEDADNEDAISAEIEKLDNRIARLGPINLAAIDEFNQLSERKTYLDQQHGDLTEALNTLQEAIRKIDLETRTRFKETYDKVNNGLQAMFPVLFGGGHAYLELTGDDLLETGVTVMARPPGKRNSTIHLLSGGEKALTALAFVFSIFELNPAPFCLLDEVDAPLDDANVVRLTEMLKSMATTVQFLYISHNKITMEIAEHLVGVTMQEAGVSRLVSVNMEEAVELAATA